jgi:pantoate--beta-alanine ligase
MIIFKRVADLQRYLTACRQAGKEIGFAPTMGALHQGHLALIRAANEQTQVSVASIFVNPTQFNDPSDLQKYPRTPESDIQQLVEASCQVLFMPSIAEIYPDGTTPSVTFEFSPLDTVLEGHFRPGHFDGMAQVVHRLLGIVQPHKLFMGQKDFQQWTIVKSMLAQTQSNVELVMMPTVREADGLAMSSRNVRLSPEFRALAPAIHEALQQCIGFSKTHSPAEVESLGAAFLTTKGFQVEYFSIADARTLQPIRLFEDTDYVVALVAAWANDVRLIDNVIVKETHWEEEENEEKYS